MQKENKQKNYIIGGGIAGLSAAVYLLQEGNIEGKNIIIYDKAKTFGGCLDGKYSKKGHGYKMRGIRVFEDTAYTCTIDLLNRVPGTKKKKTLLQKFNKFNKHTSVYFRSRLLKDGKILNAKKLRLSLLDRIKIIQLLFSREEKLGNLKINDFFTKNFFESNFWYEFSTVFAFQPFHSLIEARRYLLRSIHRCQYFDTLEPLKVTKHNQYEDMILPIIAYLKNNGVKFKNNTKITQVKFKKQGDKKRVENFVIEKNEKFLQINLEENDFAFISLGSMVSNSSIGTMTKAAIEKIENKSVSRTLWENIAKGNPEFGNPKNYSTKINKTKWISFTITIKDPKVMKLFNIFLTKNIALGGTTIIDSNWFISLGIHPKHLFLDQEKDTSIIWGYGLNPEKKGNFVKKKMKDCNGKELIKEVVYHLGLENKLDFIIKNSVCIPCMTPFVTAHFMPRKKGDRPKVVPDTSMNFAFLGQYTEIPDDIVFTVEYSVRSAQIAVYSLLGLNKKITPIYKGVYNIRVLLTALKTLFR